MLGCQRIPPPSHLNPLSLPSPQPGAPSSARCAPSSAHTTHKYLILRSLWRRLGRTELQREFAGCAVWANRHPAWRIPSSAPTPAEGLRSVSGSALLRQYSHSERCTEMHPSTRRISAFARNGSRPSIDMATRQSRRRRASTSWFTSRSICGHGFSNIKPRTIAAVLCQNAANSQEASVCCGKTQEPTLSEKRERRQQVSRNLTSKDARYAEMDAAGCPTNLLMAALFAASAFSLPRWSVTLYKTFSSGANRASKCARQAQIRNTSSTAANSPGPIPAG